MLFLLIKKDAAALEYKLTTDNNDNFIHHENIGPSSPPSSPPPGLPWPGSGGRVSPGNRGAVSGPAPVR